MSSIIFLLVFYWRLALSLYNFLKFMSRGQDQLYVRWHSIHTLAFFIFFLFFISEMARSNKETLAVNIILMKTTTGYKHSST